MLDGIILGNWQTWRGFMLKKFQDVINVCVHVIVQQISVGEDKLANLHDLGFNSLVCKGREGKREGKGGKEKGRERERVKAGWRYVCTKQIKKRRQH